MEINMNNYYIKHAKEIQYICERDNCDVGVALMKFDNENGSGGTVDEAKEFLHLVNESIRKDDKDGMTLSKLSELV